MERRRAARGDLPARFAINLLRANRSVTVSGVNVSESGICLRIQEILEVRSLVRLQLTASRQGEERPAARGGRGPRPVQCAGRVIWVVQRLDLRESPPFLYDIGIEFVDPPASLRQLMARQSGATSPAASAPAIRPPEPARIRGRIYVPTIEHTDNIPLPWHLVVSVDGIPCYSSRYPSSRTARTGWEQFKRRQARRIAKKG